MPEVGKMDLVLKVFHDLWKWLGFKSGADYLFACSEKPGWVRETMIKKAKNGVSPEGQKEE